MSIKLKEVVMQKSSIVASAVVVLAVSMVSLSAAESETLTGQVLVNSRFECLCILRTLKGNKMTT